MRAWWSCWLCWECKLAPPVGAVKVMLPVAGYDVSVGLPPAGW